MRERREKGEGEKREGQGEKGQGERKGERQTETKRMLNLSIPMSQSVTSDNPNTTVHISQWGWNIDKCKYW